MEREREREREREQALDEERERGETVCKHSIPKPAMGMDEH